MRTLSINFPPFHDSLRRDHSGTLRCRRVGHPDVTQLRESSLRWDSLWVVTRKDQHLGHGQHGDSMRFHLLGRFLRDQPLKLFVVRFDMLMQRKPASYDRAHCRLGGCRRGCDLSWPPSSNTTYQNNPSTGLIKGVTKVFWCIYDQCFRCDHGFWSG